MAGWNRALVLPGRARRLDAHRAFGSIEPDQEMCRRADCIDRSSRGADCWAGSNGEMRLQQGNSRLVGECEFSFEPLGVQWNSAKLVTPAQLNLRLPLSLVRQQQLASGIDNTERFPDLAQLRSGALIPCRLERADLTHTWLATPFSAEAVRVDNRELCAVEFRPKRTKPGFTKESREMALSIPRNLEVDLYTHLLIGQNGDLLRGNLVSISERTIEVDSRLEPILVERQFVDTVVYLHPSSESSAPAPTAETQSNPEAQPASDAKPTSDTPSTHECKLSLKLAGGFSIHGSWTGGNTKMIELNTTELGVCRIDVESIQSFHYHAALEPDGEGPGYYAGARDRLSVHAGKHRLKTARVRGVRWSAR